MPSVTKPLPAIVIALFLAGCVATGSTGPNVDLLERVTGDDVDGDCRIPGPGDDDGPC